MYPTLYNVSYNVRGPISNEKLTGTFRNRMLEYEFIVWIVAGSERGYSNKEGTAARVLRVVYGAPCPHDAVTPCPRDPVPPCPRDPEQWWNWLSSTNTSVLKKIVLFQQQKVPMVIKVN